MKRGIMILCVLCSLLFYKSANAQFLKKLKEKAGQIGNKVVDKKVDDAVDKKIGTNTTGNTTGNTSSSHGGPANKGGAG